MLRHEENGLLIPLNDTSALVDSICRFFNDTLLMRECSKSAHIFVADRFNAKRVADLVMSVYDKIFSS